MNTIDDASKYYKKAAEAPPKYNQICSACSLSMMYLSEMLNYMLAVTKQEKVPKFKDKIEEWKRNIAVCEKIYNGSNQEENFIKSLYNIIVCIENFEEYQHFNKWEEKRNLKEWIDNLNEIAKYIEGSLQKVIEYATKQMDHCKSKTLYKSTENKPSL
jgi:bacterioferritin (cytochrome b1)